ncbi:hypothetical protein GCM10011375_07390 [Hymenobacter qilianensis]|uniref:Uncharacterized protein n=1 Tax=Hymenobacter qilianensis TaxID=1385715 RepID=A0ACB5PN02_9BACT|nr:hypothetical protein GCM10011375_07390 [Hymenobacter qilianensis]
MCRGVRLATVGVSGSGAEVLVCGGKRSVRMNKAIDMTVDLVTLLLARRGWADHIIFADEKC